MQTKQCLVAFVEAFINVDNNNRVIGENKLELRND